MSPKKSKTTKPTLKKAGTMAATAAAGQDYLKRSWGKARLNKVNAVLNARDQQDTTTSSSSSSDETSSSSNATKPTKPKLSKTRTMQNTTNEAKALLGKQVLADTRLETKRRQAAVAAKKTLEKVNKPKRGRKPAIKRLGTMAKTANEGKAYIKRTGKKTTTGRKRGSGRAKK